MYTTAARRITEERVNVRVTVVRHRYYSMRSGKRPRQRQQSGCARLC